MLSATFVNLAIIAVTCVVSFAGFSNPRLIDRLILWPPAITRGREYWRLASCGLIHADGQHLLFNMRSVRRPRRAEDPRTG